MEIKLWTILFLQEIFQTNINITLISPTIIGSLIYFHMNKPLYMELFDLKTDSDYENYIKTTFTIHIQKTVKALLLQGN